MDPLFCLTASELRRLLEELMPTDSEYEAFVLDYFPALKRRWSANMDRIARTDLLFESIQLNLLLIKLREVFPNAHRYMITVESGADFGRKYPLPHEGEIRIGRDPACEIVIPERWVSRRHAVLALRHDVVTLIKEGKSLIYRNGVEIADRAVLLSGDHIKINDTTLQFHGPTPPAASEAVSRFQPGPAYTLDERVQESSPGPASTAIPQKDNYLLWGLADRLLARNCVEDVERMVGPRFADLRKRAEAGEVLEEAAISEALKYALKLAIATKKDRWFAWIFELATICEYKMNAKFLGELYPPLSTHHPAIGEQIDIYLQNVASDKVRLHLILMRRQCAG